MQTNYKIFSHYALQNYISQNKVRLIRNKILSDGANANWYTPAAGCTGWEFIEINCVVYSFKTLEEAFEYYSQLRVAPEPIKRVIKMDYDILSNPISFDYNPLRYDFFKSCRFRSIDAVLNETILKDGRVSVLYANLPPRTHDPEKYFNVEYYLVIGRLVFMHCKPEPLILLEALINSEYLTTWRPELTGKLYYVPAYKLSTFNKYHGKYLKDVQITKSFVTPTGELAEVYAQKDNPGRCRILTGNLIYSFKTVADCEIIIDALIANDIRVQSTFNIESVKKRLDVVGARLNRALNADMSNYKSVALTVSNTGFLTGLTAII